ncbi:condensation domain-containing protein [Scytonema sp. NUACC26]|uniref:condensation domain-containing protein n=1 Tax=Scytonema sp. NUACC26 TaxID=3140176 RepID=UPI0034DC140E
MDISSSGLSSSEKRKLLAKLLAQRQTNQLPLTFAQQRLWYIEQRCTGLPVYIVPGVFRLRGELDVEALRRCLDYIVDRQETLRVTFCVKDEQVWQFIHPSRSTSLTVYELESLPIEQREAHACLLIERELETPFDFRTGPLFRSLLLKLSSHEHLLVFNLHNIIADGWSIGILYREFSQVYAAFREGQSSPLSPLPLRYTKFIQNLYHDFQGNLLERECAYWRKKFRELPRLKLPPAPRIDSYASHSGGAVEFSIAADVVIGLRALARSQGATLFMSLLAAFGAYLHLYLQQDRLVVATPVANRNHTSLEGLMGMFVTTLVLHVDLRGMPTFRTLLARIRAETKESYAHPQVPFNNLLADLPFPDSDARNPLAHFMLAYHGSIVQPFTLPQLEIDSVQSTLKTSGYELELHLSDNLETSLSSQEQLGGLSGELYHSDRFDSSTVAQIVFDFQSLVRCLISEPDLSIAAFPARLNRLTTTLAPLDPH